MEQYLYLLRGYEDTLYRRGDPYMPTAGVIPEAPDMVEPEDGELPEVHPRVARRRRAPVGRGRGRGQAAPAGSPAREEEPQQGVHTDRSPDFDFGMTDAGFLSLGLAGPPHPTLDTQAGTSHSQASIMQLQIEAPLPWFSEQFVPSCVSPSALHTGH
ncbi:hypothetical protein PIB30_057318 [Stylosanthes scabra]|uniref:Uncharacterized protein n=1 Tax=Stylosanthes scabra TaxID=79078 RepID=A0ABU6RK68_9FABA|nr:hypothetical protein [Stylosanthes scabra]